MLFLRRTHVKLAFLIGLLVAQVAVALPVAAQNPRINRQQPGGNLEGGGLEPVEQPTHPTRPTIQKPGWSATTGQSHRIGAQPQIQLLFTASPMSAMPSGFQYGTSSITPQGNSLYDSCPEEFFGGKDRRVVREMERNGQPIYAASPDNSYWLPRGRIELAGKPIRTGAYAFNLPKTDGACGVLWAEYQGNRVIYQKCDHEGRPVGFPESSRCEYVHTIHWPVFGYTGCASPGEGQVPVCTGPFVWFAVGVRTVWFGPNRFEFSLSESPNGLKIATVIAADGEVTYAMYR